MVEEAAGGADASDVGADPAPRVKNARAGGILGMIERDLVVKGPRDGEARENKP